jgi:lipoprotein-anchoring transpeptidase ErfK/SrfK
MNSVYWKAEHGHYKYGKPDTDLGRDAYGPRFFRLSYPNANDRKRFSRLKKEGKIPRSAGIGSGIAIHGTNDPPSMGGRASSGCIRLLNDKIVTLDRYIVRGTAVLILPD